MWCFHSSKAGKFGKRSACIECVSEYTRKHSQKPEVKNLRAIQLLLGHTKLESTVRYLGIEVDDALEMAEQTEV